MTKKNNDIVEGLDTPAAELPVVVTENTALQAAATPTDIVNQVTLIQNVMKDVMKLDIHYGVIPGTGGKPTLLKPGAEKLVLTFRLDPQYTWEKELMENGHRSYEFECTLYHIDSGKRLGSGTGICSTMEKKYRWRNKKYKCPRCGNETIIKGKEEYGGGWLCWKKEGVSDGCGAKYNDGDPAIENQEVGKIENPDIADCWNTVKKMAKKRAFVDAVLTVTAASDIFTQDVEEMPRDMLGNNKPVKQPDYTPRKKTGAFAFLEEAQKLKKSLLKIRGNEIGDAIYREVLKNYGVEKSNEIRDRESQEAFFKELRVRVKAEKEATPEDDLPIFAVDDKKVKAEYNRLIKKQANDTMPDIDPADVDGFFDLCDPNKHIKNDKEFNNYLTLGQFENAVEWIYKQWEAK